MKRLHNRIASIGILLALAFSFFTVPVAAAEASLAQLDELNRQISSSKAQLDPLQEEVNQKTIGLVPLIYAEVIETTPQYIVKGGAFSLEALVGAGTPYYIIKNPQDGSVNILGAYSGRHAPLGKVQVQVDGRYATATVLGPVPAEIWNLEKRLSDLETQHDQLVKQRDDLEKTLENQFAAKLKNHQPAITEGLLFQIGNPMMLSRGWDIIIEAGNLHAMPTVTDGNTMIPIRALVEGLRGTVEWNQVDQSALCKLNGKAIALSVGSNTAVVNGTPIEITSPVSIQNGKTMVPLRFVSEHLGAKVEWMGADQTIHITMLPIEEPPQVQMGEDGILWLVKNYKSVSSFSEGLAIVETNELYSKWGYINKTGKVVIQPNYGDAKPFSEGLAQVWTARDTDRTTGFIDKTGKIVIPLGYDNADSFNEGLAPVCKRDYYGEKWGFIDKTGEIVIPLIYERAGAFSEGLAPVKKDGKWGYIDKTGEMVIQPVFYEAKPFSEGLAAVGNWEGGDKKWGYINKTGETIIPLTYYSAGPFSEGLAKVQARDGTGFIDKTGEMVIQPIYSDAGSFNEGLAPVYAGSWVVGAGGEWGYIDKTGKVIIPLTYGDAKPFSEGLAPVKKDGKWGFLVNPLIQEEN